MTLAEVPEPKPRLTEAPVRVRAAGVLEVRRGYG